VIRSAGAETEFTDDDLAVVRRLEETARRVNQELDRELYRRHTKAMMEGFFAAEGSRVDLSVEEVFAWIDSHWRCLSCRKFYGPEDDDCRPVCDNCRAAISHPS